jgi:ribosomal protein S12 methylthiotransferase
VGFIAPAREESLTALREMAAGKRADQVLLVAGCWAQRDPQAILAAVPGVDGLLGARRWMDVAVVVRRLMDADRRDVVCHLPDVPLADDVPDVPRVAVQGASAYLKIADGCDRACAFCAIPHIKGGAVSRPLSRLLEDAALLVRRGVKEINLIAQDTTTYGRDLGLTDGLALLLERLAERVPEGELAAGCSTPFPAR